MHLKVLIFTLSFLTTSALPLQRTVRDATWNNPKVNHAHDKTELSKDVNHIYKSHIDSSDIYSQEDGDNKNPMAEEMQHKLNMESERLRTRLRQELAELQERLSPSPAHLSSIVASMRERLAPLTQQLQSSLSSNTQDLCGQLGLYLQALETAEAQSETSPALYQEAFHWISQTLGHSSSKLASVISDFHTKTDRLIEQIRETSASEEESAKFDLWHKIRSGLGQEVNSIRSEAQTRVGALKGELAAALETAQPFRDEFEIKVEQFCKNPTLQTHVFQNRMEELFSGLEEELEDRRGSILPLSASSTSTQPGGSLPGDFSIKLSALIQDILHSVQ